MASAPKQPVTIVTPELLEFRKACLSHAADLVSGAKRLHESGLHHLAFHLAVLALEEVGKAELAGMGEHSPKEDREDSAAWSTSRMDDHVRKLFFAIWSPFLSADGLTKEQFEQHQGLAKRTHELRLRALYVGVGSEGVLEPRNALKPEDAASLIRLADSRTQLEQTVEIREPEGATRAARDWFLVATRDQMKRRWIFGAASMDKLRDLGSAKAWILWLFEQDQEQERQAIAYAKAEMERAEPSGDERMNPKWKMKVRLATFSHSIRQRDLDWFNGLQGWIRLFPAGKQKDQLVVEFTVPASISVHSLWWAGLGMCNGFVIALNIASMGLFWWHGPHLTDKYYESIEDLEKRAGINVTRSPQLRVNFGNLVLGKAELRRAVICQGALPARDETEMLEPYNAYLTGLCWFARTDVLMQMELEAFVCFSQAMERAMHVYKVADPAKGYKEDFERITADYLPPEGVKRFADLSARALDGTLDRKEITLSEVGGMKIITDCFLWTQLEQAFATKHPLVDAPGLGGDSSIEAKPSTAPESTRRT